MAVHATIFLTKEVKDLDKAEDWYAEVKELLQGHTSCDFTGSASNQEPKTEIKEDPPYD